MSAKPRCILHVGTMKTGTSTIQQWLSDNRKPLAEVGWTYAGWPCRGSERIQRIVSGLEPDQNLIISDEGLWHFSQSKSKTDEIAQILSQFDVTVVLYIRRPDHFLESWFKQGLKFGNGAVDIPTFLASPQVQPEGFERRLRRFQRLFGKGNILVAPYERAQMRNSSIVEDFISRTGLPVTEAFRSSAKDSNVSPSAEVMLIAGLARLGLSCDQKVIDGLLQSPPVANLAKMRTSLFTPAEAAKIRDAYRPLYRRIQKQFGTGAGPDFILNWGDREIPLPVSPFREIYEQIGSLTGDFSDKRLHEHS